MAPKVLARDPPVVRAASGGIHPMQIATRVAVGRGRRESPRGRVKPRLSLLLLCLLGSQVFPADFHPTSFFWNRWQRTRDYLIWQINRTQRGEDRLFWVETLLMLDPDFSFLELERENGESFSLDGPKERTPVDDWRGCWTCGQRVGHADGCTRWNKWQRAEPPASVAPRSEPSGAAPASTAPLVGEAPRREADTAMAPPPKLRKLWRDVDDGPGGNQ